MTLLLQILFFLGDCALDLARNEHVATDLGAGETRAEK